MNNNKVAAVVVTFNRLSLLKRCIESLRGQTEKNLDMVVVNNGSTDETEEWLMQQSDLIVINQGNYGGSGGFYTGTKYAYDKGYEWVWMMDDDGEADIQQLEKLLLGAKRLNACYVNALVGSIEDKKGLSFAFSLNGKRIDTIAEAQKQTEIRNFTAPFNGTLIHRSVIDKVGFIKKEMFIWGDEVEYTCRISNAGFEKYTITDALHYHPLPRNNYVRVVPFINKVRVQIASKERGPILYRNIGYNRRYGRRRGTIYVIAIYTMYYLIRLDIKGLLSFHRYFNQGLNDEYPNVEIKIKSIKDKRE